MGKADPATSKLPSAVIDPIFPKTSDNFCTKPSTISPPRAEPSGRALSRCTVAADLNGQGDHGQTAVRSERWPRVDPLRRGPSRNGLRVLRRALVSDVKSSRSFRGRYALRRHLLHLASPPSQGM